MTLMSLLLLKLGSLQTLPLLNYLMLFLVDSPSLTLFVHGRQNGFESGTAEGVEHESPEAANRDAEGVAGFYPSPTGSGGNVLEICANWCILEHKSLLKLLGQIQINIAFITTSVRFNLIVHNLFFSQGRLALITFNFHKTR